MNKNKISILAGAVVVSLLVIATVIAPIINKKTTLATKETEIKVEENGNMPRFMYFVTNSDLENKEINAVLEKLENEFSKQVIFEIKNIDEDKSLKERFDEVVGNTPALIMLDASADIVTFLFKTTDYEKLEEAVRAALKN